MRLSEAARVLEAKFNGEDHPFLGVSTDSRNIEKGDLFFALVGPRFDAHDYVASVFDKGAAGAVVSRELKAALPLIQVQNTQMALGQLAANWRTRFDIPVVAVTGSNGKTTVKEMIASIMSQTGEGLATRGNLNNEIGMPLTLLRLRDHHKFAVIEMGMNHAGEIGYLSKIAHPTIALITNAGEAHLEGVGDIEDVARAKGEIFSGLDSRGVGIVNADDPWCDYWRALIEPRQTISFGVKLKADVSADFELGAIGSLVRLRTTEGETDMRLPLLGTHNVMNALAAAAASIAAGAELVHVRGGLESMEPVPGRLQLKAGLGGSKIIDDTYNANPASVTAGMEVLKSVSGERILVLGDMLELGDFSETIHQRIGATAARIGIERLYAIGDLTRHTIKGFGRNAMHFETRDELLNELKKNLGADVTVLVKGSRMMRMDLVVKEIVIEKD